MKAMLTLSVLLLLTACAHHRDVRPGADGVHRVVVRGPEAKDVERSALSQANHFCEERKLSAAILNEEKTQYTGSMDEETRKTVKKASTAAMVVGSAISMGSRGDGGKVLGGAGAVGHIMTSGDDYVADMKFKCQ